jgi:hypothetical protein
MRYVVFGIDTFDADTLVENHTDRCRTVAVLVYLNSLAGYKARVWDVRKMRFIKQSVIDRYVNFLNRRAHHA